MGTSTSWLAVEGVALDEIARDLGLVRVDRFPEKPSELEAYRAGLLPSGWVVLVQAMDGNGLVHDAALLADLSRRYRVVGCDEESHVMYSAAAEWNMGKERWAVVHDSQVAARHIAVRGAPPRDWEEARDAVMAEQDAADADGDDVDYLYELPLQLAQQIVGYRVESESEDDLCVILARPQRSVGRASSGAKNV